MNNLVKVENNSKYGFVVSSRNVSIVVKRRHDNVMRDIEKIITEGSPQIRGLFIKSEYIASNGKKNKEYLLLKDGVILYLFNVQGLYEKKMAYINEFNRMEQALRKPRQTKLDFQNQTPIRTTWKGEPVMEVVQLSKMTGITNGNIHWRVYGKKVTLRYKELQEYKQENRKVNHKGYSAISILSKEMVIAICKKYGIYEKYKDFIENYFRVDNRIEDKTPKIPVVRANFDKEPFEDNYYNRMFECMKKAYIIESRIEKIYDEELLPLYNKIEELNRAKKDCLISPFNAMKYGSVLGKAKINK
ncbi:Rha family transcriptional regulator [Fusobacterium necrophorum]|nr:Rha family transcriptional regulator [Fusobacterium necrophorum]MDK4515665.1 Rha family transcriptional regulator [Fusobacterium necrophorum]